MHVAERRAFVKYALLSNDVMVVSDVSTTRAVTLPDKHMDALEHPMLHVSLMFLIRRRV